MLSRVNLSGLDVLASLKNRQNIFLSLFVLGGVILVTYNYLVSTVYFPIISVGDDENIRKYEYPNKMNRFLAAELLIDKKEQSLDEIVRRAQAVLPNFPVAFWEKNKNNGSLLSDESKSCAKFPKVYDLLVNNLYWQILSVDRGNIYLLSAFYDVRKRCTVCPAVRLLAMVEPRAIIPDKAYCQIWFDDNKGPIIVEGKYDHLSPFGRLYPYMITCSVNGTSAERIPIYVSLVNEKCDGATNSLRVIFDKPDDGRKKSFAVCVKHLDFLHVDMSVRLIEWIELVRLLGAEKITLYTLHVHENVSKVLKYYEERGVVEIRQTTLAGDQPNAPYFQHIYFNNAGGWTRIFGNEVLELNDCFYRNMYKYDYIVPIDTDEVIMPSRASNWAGLMNDMLKSASSRSTNETIASYGAYMVVFPNCPNMSLYNDIPDYTYVLQHVLADKDERIINPTVKSILDSEITQAAHNHHAIRSLSENGTLRYGITREDAELYHYRNTPYSESGWRCDFLIQNHSTNTNVWRFKEPLINRTLATLYNLRFYGHG